MQVQDTNHEIHVEKDINIHLENKKVSMHFFWFIWFIYAIVSMTKNCFSAAMADIVEQGIMIKSQTELITSIFYVFYTPMQIVGGILSDKFSPEKMIKIGLIGAAVSNAVIFFFSESYPVMMAAWIFNAIIQFGVWPGIFKIVSSQCVRSERPKMLFLISLSFTAGLFLSYGLGAVLTDWRMNFSISAISLIALAIALHFYDKHIDKYMKWDRVEVQNASAQPGNDGKTMSTMKLFWSSGFIILLLVIVLRDSLTTIVRRIAATMLNETFEVGASVGTLMSMLIVATSIVGFVIAHEMLQHRVIKNYVKGIIVGLACALVIAVLFVFAKNLAANVISMCLIAGITTATSLFTTRINSIYVKYGKNATAAGLANAASACGYVAPFIAVLIQEQSGSWQSVKLLLIGVAIAGVISTVCALPLYSRFMRREKAENV